MSSRTNELSGTGNSTESNLQLKDGPYSELLAQARSGLKKLKKFTKRLKIQSASKQMDKRKLVVSTNFIKVASGLEKGDRVVEELVGPQGGIRVRRATAAEIETTKTKQVYSRTYAKRPEGDSKNETMLDIRSQKLLDEAFGEASEVLVEFRDGEILILPLGVEVGQGAQNQPGAAYTEFSADENGLYSMVTRAVEVIRARGFKSVSYKGSEEFFASEEHLFFELQMRRMGYQMGARVAQKDESGMYTCKATKDVASATETRIVDISAQETITTNHGEAVVQAFVENPSLDAYGVFTAGIDLCSAQEYGFTPVTAVEYRPVEARDLKAMVDPVTKKAMKDQHGRSIKSGELSIDKTETGVVSICMNLPSVENLHNIDVFDFPIERYVDDFKGAVLATFSPPCTEFSSLKDGTDKRLAIEELTTSVDCFIPMLRIIEKAKTPCVLIENVKQFAKSTACLLVEKRLQDMGYKTYKIVLGGKKTNSFTMRERCFVFASALPAEFSFPDAVPHTADLWRTCIAPYIAQGIQPCTEDSVERSIRKKKLRFIDEDTKIAAAIPKCQNKMVNEALRIKLGDSYFWPNIPMLKAIMSIPQWFNTSFYNRNEIGYEIIGQSIDFVTHGAILEKVREHIFDAASQLAIQIKGALSHEIRQVMSGANLKKPASPEQMSLAF